MLLKHIHIIDCFILIGLINFNIRGAAFICIFTLILMNDQAILAQKYNTSAVSQPSYKLI
jgi:hypothetical protein